MPKKSSVVRKSLLFPLMLALAACGGPLDTKLTTGKGNEAYYATLNPLFAKFSEREQQAFNWAVSDIDQDQLHAKYPNATARQVIRGEVAQVLAQYPARVAQLTPAAAQAEQTRAELDKLTLHDASVTLTNSSFGLMPQVRFTVQNNSALPLSSTAWLVYLHLNGSEESVAHYRLNANFEDIGGLKPGQHAVVKRDVGFVTGEASWITLEVRNAQRRELRFAQDYSGALDFGNRPHLSQDPAGQIEKLTQTIATATGYKDI